MNGGVAGASIAMNSLRGGSKQLFLRTGGV